MHAIPTIYKSVQFRSRLEAKWAAFFDLLGWQWEYEPFDLEGWIPDFALIGRERLPEDCGPHGNELATQILVEVKPVVNLPRNVAAEMYGCAPHLDLLICGTGPFWNGDNECIGWLHEPGFDHSTFADAPMGLWRNSKKWGFCHSEQSFHDRISGCYDGGSYGADHRDFEALRQLWARAANAVQWKAPK